MKKIKVKVFDAYSVDDEYKDILGIDNGFIFEYHNQIVGKDGFVHPRKHWKDKLPAFKPLPEHLNLVVRYELDDEERQTLSMLKSTEDQLKKIYDSAKRKRLKYKKLLLNKVVRENDDIFEGEQWECKLSPFGHCIYHYDEGGEISCIFCGEPEERK